MDMQSFGKKTPTRKIDQLYLFGTTLAKGGVRHRIFQTLVQRAQYKKRLPEQADSVLSEIVSRLQGTLKETDMQMIFLGLPHHGMIIWYIVFISIGVLMIL